jgi:D-alanine transaminase
MTALSYLNGEYLAIDEAKVSVLDRGFMFGDGVYEVIPIHNGQPFKSREHIMRLDHNLEQIHIQIPHTFEQWQAVIHNLIDNNPGQDRSIYIQITRGVSNRQHAINIDSQPTVFAMINPLLKQDRSIGISTIVVEDIRWQYCHIKAITLLPGVLLRHEAKQAGADEAILVRDGWVTEGAASNIFIVQDNMIKTPPKSPHILPGITRELLVELLYESDILFAETPITEQELRQANEVWLTSSTWDVVPVIKLDSDPVASGQPGEFWKKTSELYQQLKSELVIG